MVNRPFNMDLWFWWIFLWSFLEVLRAPWYHHQLCFFLSQRFFWGESTSAASQLSHKINKVSLLLENLGFSLKVIRKLETFCPFELNLDVFWKELIGYDSKIFTSLDFNYVKPCLDWLKLKLQLLTLWLGVLMT